MKNRDYKKFAPQTIWHVFNRGVGRMNVFVDIDDYYFFLRRMKEALYPETINEAGRKYIPKKFPSDAFHLLLYCLMPNHFHLVVQQMTDLSIAELMSKVCTSYSMYFNKKYGRVGGVWQDQFKAVMVESNEQLIYLAWYIHMNPIKAGLVKTLKKYPFSSYLDYVAERNGKLCDKNLILGQFQTVEQFTQAMVGIDDSFVLAELKLDDDVFVV